MATAADVAKYMAEELAKFPYLYQQKVALQIYERFGGDFVYVNKNGDLAIDPDVLTEFRNLNHRSVVWEREEYRWRYRRPTDKGGRSQDRPLPIRSVPATNG